MGDETAQHPLSLRLYFEDTLENLIHCGNKLLRPASFFFFCHVSPSKCVTAFSKLVIMAPSVFSC